MGANKTGNKDGRAILVVVGPDSPSRTDTARTLIDEGQSVVLCSGPPGCPLVREEPCVLIDVADAVVFMPPSPTHDRRIDAALSMCAQTARCSIVLEGPTKVAWPDHAIHVASDDLVGVARGVGRTAP